eukprot:975139_1
MFYIPIVVSIVYAICMPIFISMYLNSKRSRQEENSNADGAMIERNDHPVISEMHIGDEAMVIERNDYPVISEMHIGVGGYPCTPPRPHLYLNQLDVDVFSSSLESTLSIHSCDMDWPSVTDSDTSPSETPTPS